MAYNNRRLKKMYINMILFLIVLIVLLTNAGRFFDITQKPKKADIIVYLGGGGPERINKALEIYKQGYSETGKLIITGPPSFYTFENKKKRFQNRRAYFIDHGVSGRSIIAIKKLRNTMKEVLFIKDYMLLYNLKKVMFISDPPHSRRIIFLANSVADYKESGLSSFVVGSDTLWWSKNDYYKDIKAITFIVSESIKLSYNYVAYGVLERLGLLEVVKKYTDPLVRFIKSKASLFFDEIVFSNTDNFSTTDEP